MLLHWFSEIKSFDCSSTGSETQSKLWMFEYTTYSSSVKDLNEFSSNINVTIQRAIKRVISLKNFFNINPKISFLFFAIILHLYI